MPTVLLPYARLSSFFVLLSASGMRVAIKRVLGIPFAHGSTDLVCGHPALVKPCREEPYGNYVGQQQLLLDCVQFQGKTADGQLLDEPQFGQVGQQMCLVMPTSISCVCV